MNQRLNKVRKKLWINLAVNWFIPLVLVILLRSIYSNDAVALAIAGAIPAVRTLTILIWRRRVDWIGVLGVLGLTIGFTVCGGNKAVLLCYCLICKFTTVVLRYCFRSRHNQCNYGEYDYIENKRILAIN